MSAGPIHGWAAMRSLNAPQNVRALESGRSNSTPLLQITNSRFFPMSKRGEYPESIRA